MDNIIRRIVREEIRNFINKEYLMEYLDNDFGIPLYKAAKKEFGDAKIIKNTWLIHSFGGDERLAKKIMNNGFGNGLSKDELNRDGMTYSGNKKHEDKGYSWAYKAEDFIGKNRTCNYGSSILFQASGVEYFNPMDLHNQIMFYNKSAKNCILIYDWDGEENIKNKFSNYHKKDNLYAVGNINGRPLYIGYFGDVINWCITNFNQYKNNLLNNDTVLHVSDGIDIEYESYLDENGYGELPNDSANKYNKWHNFEEENDDAQNYDKFLKSEYKIFLESHKKEVEEINKTVENYIKKYPNLNTSVEIIRDTLMSNYNLSFKDFYDVFSKEHVFYDRKRPDGEYWRL